MIDLGQEADRIVRQRRQALESWLQQHEVTVRGNCTVSHFLLIYTDPLGSLAGETVCLVPNAERDQAEGLSLVQAVARYPSIRLETTVVAPRD